MCRLSSAAVVIGGLAALVALAGADRAQAQSSSCADCHLARPDWADVRGARHVADWDAGPHGRNGVGCELCHGGNPKAFEPAQAHRGILHRSHPASPVGRISLPATCGSCHGGPFTAFQKSRHYELVRSGDRNAPTCATCHGEVAAVRLSPRQLEAQCVSCHGPDRVAPANTDVAADARLLLEGLRETRALLREANGAIRRVNDPARRAALEADAEAANAPLAAATSAGHAFVFEGLQERIATARQRIAALYDRLVNPSPAAR